MSIGVINNLKFIAILIYDDCVNLLKKPWLFNFVAKIWKFHQTFVYMEKKFLTVDLKNYDKSYTRSLSFTNNFNALYYIIIFYIQNSSLTIL